MGRMKDGPERHFGHLNTRTHRPRGEGVHMDTLIQSFDNVAKRKKGKK